MKVSYCKFIESLAECKCLLFIKKNFFLLLGEGAKMILEKQFNADWAKNLKIIYCGDDTTDEDAMKMLFGIGKTFRVSELPTLKTYANYQIKTVEEVGWLLKAIQANYEKKKKA